MLEDHIDPLKELIRSELGVEVSAALNPLESRKGLSFWFENYSRSGGPIFSIRPSGLKRHHISVKFGTYSSGCVEHINNRITEDSLLTVQALISQIAENHSVEVNSSKYAGTLAITNDLRIDIVINSVGRESEEKFQASVRNVMLPLIASFVELLGYEENDTDASETEGKITLSLMKRRERSSANRVLCLSIHGEVCGVCGFVPEKKYGAIPGSIIEVHHIEPLNELDEPRPYDPKTDLIPICPNCHRTIHKRRPAYLPDELKELIQNDDPA